MAPDKSDRCVYLRCPRVSPGELLCKVIIDRMDRCWCGKFGKAVLSRQRKLLHGGRLFSGDETRTV